MTCTAGPPRSLSPSLADAESGGNISAICGGGGILSDVRPRAMSQPLVAWLLLVSCFDQVLSMARVNPP